MEKDVSGGGGRTWSRSCREEEGKRHSCEVSGTAEDKVWKREETEHQAPDDHARKRRRTVVQDTQHDRKDNRNGRRATHAAPAAATADAD